MRLNYPTPPEGGTIVAHRPNAGSDVRYRFLKIDADGFLHLTDGYTDVYPQSQSGNTHSPRSIVEYYILRRTRTPYGYAKVWGTTPRCEEVTFIPFNPKTDKVEELSPDTVTDRCGMWWRKRHPDPTKGRPIGRAYLKKIQQLYKEMTHG